jgi:hypothetical protein
MTRKELGAMLMSKRMVTKSVLSELTGLSRTQIDSIEQGRSNYTVDSLLLYCKCVNHSIRLTDLSSVKK